MTNDETDPAGLADRLRDDQRRRWHAGERIQAEAYFTEHPAILAMESSALQLLYGEIVLREESGAAPNLDEYARRFPQFADQLTLLFDVHHAIESGHLLDSVALDTSFNLATRLNNRQSPVDTIELKEASPAATSSPTVAGYEILGELGRGGMGVVYKARQIGLNRIVALKMIVVGCHADQAQLARFRAEAGVLARLEHPNIVQIHEIGAQDGRPYFSLEYVDGGSLAQRLKATPQPARPAAAFMEKLARAAHVAHQQGIVHRDLKPANILIAGSGQPSAGSGLVSTSRPGDDSLLTAAFKISDFGLAKNLHVDTGQTGSGTILGTPSYMAPEQADGRGQEIGPAADIYALGAILYELLSGAPPFKADTQLATLRLVLSEEPMSLARLHLPTDLVTICFKCLHKDPRQRYATALDLAEDLERFLGDCPIQARRAGQIEHTWRWARRNPWPAGLTAAVVLLSLLVAAVSTVASVWLKDALAESENHRLAAERANTDAKAKLWASYLDQAKAVRSSRQPGQRVAGLRALKEALRLPVPADQSLAKLRTEAIACLLLPDIEAAREWDGWPIGSKGFAINETFERYARGDQNGNVSVRRVADDRELYNLPGIGRLQDWNLRFTPDGQFLYHFGYIPGGICSRIWNLQGQKEKTVHDDDTALELRPDGRQFAVGKHKGLIRLFETATGKEVRSFETGIRIRSLSWNPQFAKLAILGPLDWRILNLESGELSAVAGTAESFNLAWHPNGRNLALVHGRQIQIFDSVTGRRVGAPFVGHQSDGVQFKFSPSGDQLLSTDWSNIWRLWDVRTGAQQLTMPTTSQSLFFSRDHGLVAADFLERKIRLFRIHPGRELRSLAHYAGDQPSRFQSVSAMKSDGRLLAVDVPEGIALIDLARTEELGVLPIPGNYPLRFAADGNELWTYGKAGLQRWPIRLDAAAGVTSVGPPEALGTPSGGNYWGASADDQVFAIPTTKGPLLWRRAANQIIPLGPQDDVRFCSVSPDGRWVATGSHDSRKGAGAKIWDAKTGEPIVDLPVGPFCNVGFSPDGRWLATSSGGVRIWSVGTWLEEVNLESAGMGRGFTFSFDSKVLAIGSGLGIVRLVETETGKEFARLTVPEQTYLWPQCFTPDGTQLVAIGMESSALYIFDLRSIRSQLAEMKLDWGQPPYAPSTLPDLTPIRVNISPSE